MFTKTIGRKPIDNGRLNFRAIWKFCVKTLKNVNIFSYDIQNTWPSWTQLRLLGKAKTGCQHSCKLTWLLATVECDHFQRFVKQPVLFFQWNLPGKPRVQHKWAWSCLLKLGHTTWAPLTCWSCLYAPPHPNLHQGCHGGAPVRSYWKRSGLVQSHNFSDEEDENRRSAVTYFSGQTFPKLRVGVLSQLCFSLFQDINWKQ